MTDLLTPGQLQSALLAKSREVDQAIEDYRSAITAHVEADKNRRVAMNTALISIEAKSVGERNAKAEKACEDEVHAEKVMAGRREIAKEAFRARLAQLSALQSMATTIREEMRLAR